MATSRGVVITAGAWTSKLVGTQVVLPRLVVTQEQPAHFTPVDDSQFWPSFNHAADPGDPRDDYWYSPVYGMLTPGEGVKAGWHGVGPVADPDARTFDPEPVQLEALRRYVREWLPGLVIRAGFSGHGFKFTPAIGRVLADLVDGIDAPRRFSARGRA